jgi:hypothetical protein
MEMHQMNGNLEVEEVDVCWFKLMWLIARESIINAEVSSPDTCYFYNDKIVKYLYKMLYK